MDADVSDCAPSRKGLYHRQPIGIQVIRTFLSIGSGPGIGAATAERFAKEAYRVVLTSRDAAKLVNRVGAFAAKGYTVESRMDDAGELSSVHALVEEVETEFGSVHVLHFNSASMHSATIETRRKETFAEDLIINIGAALVAVQGGFCGDAAQRARHHSAHRRVVRHYSEPRLLVLEYRQGRDP